MQPDRSGRQPGRDACPRATYPLESLSGKWDDDVISLLEYWTPWRGAYEVECHSKCLNDSLPLEPALTFLHPLQQK